MYRIIVIMCTIALLLFTGLLSMTGQEPASRKELAAVPELTFRHVDTTTYNLYLAGAWKELIREGKDALENGIDYYYLQMRIAYAYFSLEKYRRAARFYKNALEHNSLDPVAHEYLYYAYKYGGREHDALWQTRELTPLQKSDMEINDSISFIAFGLNYAWAGANTNAIQDQITSNTDLLNPGTQKATRTMHYASATLSHRIGKGVVFTHTGSYLFKDELSYVVTNARTFLSEAQPVNQYEYSLDGDIRIAEAWIIRPGFHYLNTTIPLYAETAYGPGSGMNRTSVSELKIVDWVQKFQLTYQSCYADLGLSYVHHDFNDIGTHQAGLHGTVYPLANLNLYLGVDAYVQFQAFNAMRTENYLIRPMVGGKIFNNLWIEVSGSPMEQFNFYDMRNNLAFNNLEKIGQSLEANAIIPLYRAGMQLFVGYRYRSMNSVFFPSQDLLNPVNPQQYQSHIITGGIKWKR